MPLLTPEQLTDRLKGNGAVQLDEITESLLEAIGCTPYVLPLPDVFIDRLQFLGNLLVQMCFNIRTTDEKLKLELIALTSALSYLLNSTSFKDQKYHTYDRNEVNRKLGRSRRRSRLTEIRMGKEHDG